MSIALYDDQTEVREAARASVRKHNCILIHAVTGFGKTVLAADMTARSQLMQKRTFFMVPRRQLLWQTAEKFNELGIDFGYIASGEDADPGKGVQMAMLKTLLTKMPGLVPPDLLFIDEGHYSFNESLPAARWVLAAGGKVVYLTATPKPGMDAVVEDVVRGESVEWMIRNRRLSAYRAFCPASPDLSMIKRVAGEYHQGQLSDKMEHDRALVGNMVKHYNTNIEGRRTLGYGTSVAHAEIMAHMFREASIPAAAIHANTPDKQLIEIIRAFARREIKVLTNCDMATFGFDLSAASGMDATVEAMIDGAPTLSITKQTQKWGRFLRMKDDPGVLNDHAGNIIHRDGTRNHGMPCEDRNWPIITGASAGTSVRATPVKQCPTCFGTHRPAPQCTMCGHVYKIDGRVIRQEDGTLIEVHKSEIKIVEEFTPEQKAMINSLKRTAIAQGVNPFKAQNWAKKKIREGMKQ